MNGVGKENKNKSFMKEQREIVYTPVISKR